MPNDKEIKFFQDEVDRAIREVRAAISAYACDCKASAAVLAVSTLLDKVECHVTPENGDDAFVLSDTARQIHFRAPILAKIWSQMGQYAEEFEADEVSRTREQQLAINQFIIHELLHIRQNFPHFASVKSIKAGVPGIGLPILDLGADMMSAWLAAVVEANRVDDQEEETVLRFYVNALIRAYIIGAFVFDARTKPEKRQRSIGLAISAALVQAKIDGTLQQEAVYAEWSPISPIYSFNFEQSETFNALVIGTLSGLLVNQTLGFNSADLNDLWDHVGKPPIHGILFQIVPFLRAVGVIA